MSHDIRTPMNAVIGFATLALANAGNTEKVKDYLSKDEKGNPKHEVWIDTSEIKAGDDWREKIAKGS